ncbi:MAG TPA: hypothetical protein VIJ93_07975 [bacterium]
MKHFELNVSVGNLKTNKIGKIASAAFKANSGDFNGFVVLTDSYGYEVWDESSIVLLPTDFVKSPSTLPL